MATQIIINAANNTNTDSDHMTIQKELDQSIDQIDDNANVNYNGKYFLNGSKSQKEETKMNLQLFNSHLNDEKKLRS